MLLSRVLILIAIFISPISALAQSETKDRVPAIDFTTRLHGPTGQSIMRPGYDCQLGDTIGKDKCQLISETLGDVAVHALESTIDKDRGEDPLKKFGRDQLARKIFGNSHAILAPDEVALIKQRIGDVEGASDIGATWPLLDPTLTK